MSTPPIETFSSHRAIVCADETGDLCWTKDYVALRAERDALDARNTEILIYNRNLASDYTAALCRVEGLETMVRHLSDQLKRTEEGGVNRFNLAFEEATTLRAERDDYRKALAEVMGDFWSAQVSSKMETNTDWEHRASIRLTRAVLTKHAQGNTEGGK